MFGERLKQLRAENDMFQKDLAVIMNVTPGAVGMYETGKRQPSYEILDKVASYFDVSVDWLMGRTNIRSNNPKKSWTWEELRDIATDDIKEFFSEENIQLVNFVKELKKEDIPVEVLRELVKTIKNINK